MAMRPSPLFSTVIRLCIAVLYLLESASVSSGIGEVCILGSTEVTETSFLNGGGQYLDFGHPAPCTGNLTAWHFCYYAADISLTSDGEVRTYVVEFRVWRTVDGNSFSRVHVDRLTMAISPPSNGQTLICETATLSPPLDVLTNDILGVYVFTTNTLARPLHIIARDTSDFGVRFDTRDNGSLDFIPFNSDTVNINDLENRPTLGLHLYADIAIICDDLSDPVNGQVLVTPDAMATADTDLCAVAVYTCNDGYNLVGDVMRTCQASGQWDGVEPTCMLIDCGGLANPSDGQVTITPGLVAMTGEGAMATYTCSEGYSLINGTVRTCQVDGQWDGAEPTCMLIDCGGLDNPSDGQVTITPGLVAMTGEDAMATYACTTITGHMLVGTAIRTCQASGQWSGMVPTCIRCDIASITDPRNGNVAFTSPGGVITVVYTCDVGYAVVGVATRACQSDGQFSGQEPVCLVIDCGGLANPSDGQVTITPGLVAMTGEGAMATYNCSEGYRLINGTVRTCQADGQWDGAEPTCMLIDCGGLSDPANGQVTISPGLVDLTGVGATATYTCNSSTGYMLVGTAMRTCQDSGQWSGMAPTCILIDCGSPPPVDNGTINVAMTTFGSIAEYNCNEGFTLSDSQSRTCQADGTWSGADPVCVAPAQQQNSSSVVIGVVIGLLVAALIALGIVLAIIIMRRRRKAIIDHSLELQSKVSSRASEQAALIHFQPTDSVNYDTANAAYVTNADAIPVSCNEAYAITNATAITTTRNEAYGSLEPGGRGTNDYDYVINQLNDEEASDQYDYVH